MVLAPEDLETLRWAKARLEHPSLAARLTDALASPVARGLARMPRAWNRIIQFAARKSIEKGLAFAVATIRGRRRSRHSRGLHKIAVMTSGATGGAFGLAALPIELPVSTIIMMRSISDIARSEGEDLNSPETMLNCLQVFALGGRSTKDDAAETGYYAVRAAMSKAVTDAVKYISNRGLTVRGTPVLVRLITSIASRFGVIVSEEMVAMAVPGIGAVGGALINTVFLDHFQNVAQAHFSIRRLERRYGADPVREEYARL